LRGVWRIVAGKGQSGTTQKSTAQEQWRTVGAPRPDALIAHVRICGNPGRATALGQPAADWRWRVARLGDVGARRFAHAIGTRARARDSTDGLTAGGPWRGHTGKHAFSSGTYFLAQFAAFSWPGAFFCAAHGIATTPRELRRVWKRSLRAVTNLRPEGGLVIVVPGQQKGVTVGNDPGTLRRHQSDRIADHRPEGAHIFDDEPKR